MTSALPPRRLLLVHAHPDDESIGTGATMARYAADGVAVTLLTCTLGENGEILVPELAQLEQSAADQLGGYRIAELSAAMDALGVTDHRFLGGGGRFRDSGMAGAAGNDHPRAFWRAATDPAVFAEAVRAAVDVVREVRPHVVVTYDPDGQYGHPDHVMAHRVSAAAVAAAADPGFAADGDPWTVAKVYWTALSRTDLRTGLRGLAAAGTGFTDHDAGVFAGAVDDAAVTAVVDASAFTAAKAAALRAHATQVTVADGFYALSNQLGMPLTGVEAFRLAHGAPGAPFDERGRETDLFAGIAL